MTVPPPLGLPEQYERLRDALEHIAKVAGSARVPTRRLDWIVARANLALSGCEYQREDLPKYPKMRKPDGSAP